MPEVNKNFGVVGVGVERGSDAAVAPRIDRLNSFDPATVDWAALQVFPRREPDEEHPETLFELAAPLLLYPEAWFNEPHYLLGDRRPRDLVGTDEEPKVFNILTAADRGYFV